MPEEAKAQPYDHGLAIRREAPGVIPGTERWLSIAKGVNWLGLQERTAGGRDVDFPDVEPSLRNRPRIGFGGSIPDQKTPLFPTHWFLLGKPVVPPSVTKP
jgi:hypothetical protein